ncbi:MAG TPA: hypothetical protein VEP90_22345 [Methylomirabilota bacterium]|nr:hypothetical protein [Methylomirabilota bacterium]
MIELEKGTIEHVPVFVRDRTNTLTDLIGSAPTFFVRKESDEDIVIPEGPADPLGMTAYCLIDTTTIPKDRYELCLRFQNLPEVPLMVFDLAVI